MFGVMGGVEEGFSLPVLLVGLSLVFLVCDSYVAAEFLFVLGGTFFYKFENCCERGVVVSHYVEARKGEFGSGIAHELDCGIACKHNHRATQDPQVRLPSP